jgi:hypothetical protein
MLNRPSALSMVSVLWLLNSVIGAHLAIREDLPAK